ncbi:MAG TPA: hypothetical protein VIT67_20015 [Povalibacter sp.]
MFRTEQASHGVAVVLSRGLMALLLSLLAPFDAKADRFDVVSFQAPTGWSRKEQGDGLVFESRQTGSDSFCVMTLSSGYPATGSIAEELDRAWAAVLEGAKFAGDPETLAPVDVGDGVTLARRIAQVQRAQGVLITTLHLLRGGDRFVLVLAMVSDRQAWDRCGNAQGDFLAGMKLDTTTPLRQPSAPATANGSTARPGGLTAQGGPDPQMAARFNHSVVGAWRFAWTMVSWGPAPATVRQEIDVRFERDGNYRIWLQQIESEAGTYRVDGQRILMRPAGSNIDSYALDWYFGTHPEATANWGLILRSSVNWAGGDKNEWRAFKPPE